MPNCVLRATGDDFNPDNFLRHSYFAPCNIFHKGEHRSATSIWNNSGITIDVSWKSDFAQQVEDAIDFLKTHDAELRRLGKFAGVGQMNLDFGLNAKNNFVQSFCFSSKLISLANDLELTLEISVYS